MKLNIVRNSLDIPDGTKDILGYDMRVREYVIDTIKNVYERFGFQPHQTPILEYFTTFDGHHGEGEKLFFHMQDTKQQHMINRYDLTVPLARVITMNPNLPRPYKRYQIGPSFRDDVPSKSHFREFTQCDADMVGTSSLLAEAEITTMANTLLKALHIENFMIRINHRQLIKGIAQKVDIHSEEGLLGIQSALDYADKVTKDGLQGIINKLVENGIEECTASLIISNIQGLNQEMEREESLYRKLEVMKSFFDQQSVAQQGIEELETIFSYMPKDVLERIEIDLTLARGANYYTGYILEGVIKNLEIGAVLGGGRYDKLVSSLGVLDEPAVGLAFGLERLLLALEGLQCIDSKGVLKDKVLLMRDEFVSPKYMLSIASELRNYCDVDLYYDSFSKEEGIAYAHANQYPLILKVTEAEIKMYDVIENTIFKERIESIIQRIRK